MPYCTFHYCYRPISLVLAVLWGVLALLGPVQMARSQGHSVLAAAHLVCRCSCRGMKHGGVMPCCRKKLSPNGQTKICACEIYNGAPPAAVANCVPNPDGMYAPASERHTQGANYGFADGHAKWERYPVTVATTTDQPCFGQYQAF